MSIQQILDHPDFSWLAGPKEGALNGVYCCDLLSVAMSKAKTGGVWVTVMNNINTLAVASLCEVPMVIFAHGVTPDDLMLARAQQENITLAKTQLPIFEAALCVAGFAKDGMDSV